jgi:hypothetical protein
MFWVDNMPVPNYNALVPRMYSFVLSSSEEMLRDSRLNPVVKSDILRYEVLRLFGGIYLDIDIEVLRNFDELLDESFFCADEGMGNIGTAVLGCVPYHPLTHAMLSAIYENYKKNGPPKSPNDQMAFGGPWLFTKISKQFNITVLPRQLLYPFHNPKLPATVHYFNGGESSTGWTKKISKDNNDPKPQLIEAVNVNPTHSTPDMARRRPRTRTFDRHVGPNNKVLP